MTQKEETTQQEETENPYKGVYTPEYFAANAKSIPLQATLLGEGPVGEFFIKTYHTEPSVQPGLHRFNPETGEICLLATASAPHLEIYDAVYEDNWLVWAEATQDMISADWTIWAMNLIDGTVITVAKSELSVEDVETYTMTYLAPMIFDSSLSEGILLWSSYGKLGHKVVACVKMYDLNTGKRKMLDWDADIDLEKFDFPNIDYPYVVYSWYTLIPGKGTEGKVMLLDLRTLKKQQLDEGFRYGNPKVRYPYVAWDAGNNRFILYNLDSQESTVISGAQQCWYPMLNEQVLTWFNTDAQLKVYLLPSGPRTVLAEGVGNFRFVKDYVFWWPKTEEQGITYYLKLP